MHTTPLELKVTKGTIVPPQGGWKQNTFYICEVAFSSSNVIHRSIIHVGFFEDQNKPFNGSYMEAWSGQGMYHPKDLYYVKAIKVIKEMKGF